MADPQAAVHSEEEHIDVERSQEIFHELERELSTRSEGDGNRLGYAGVGHGHDLEKSCDDEGRFNLRDFLQSSNNANQSAGIKHKHVGVTWNDLEVEVVGGADFKIYIGTFGAEIINFFLFPILYVWRFILTIIHVESAQLPTRTILHKQSGVVKPGEMCLVLGCPGAGCTTFLKAIANERHEYIRVGGDVRYAGIDAAEMERTYKGEVAYNEEDDRHIPTLTVGQTISFALSTKTPGPNGRLPGLSRAEFNEKVENMLLRMLNISHTKQTYVGDEFVRGVSGGERKRVSIAETMATRARVLCFDNSTRGLDASTALDFIKAMRAMTDILGQTTFATLYQAGEGIYELFDKVIVLDKGRQVFFGPPSEARAYFENLGYKSLPRQSTADYLTGCTDPNERRFAPGRSFADVPASPEALEAAFRSSSYASEMQLSLEKYKDSMDTEKQDQVTFKEAVAAEKKRGVSKKSPYTVGFFGQVKALVKRNLQTRMQDKFTLVTSYTLTTILAFIIGGAYFNQPLNAAGAYGGAFMVWELFTCLAFLTMQGFFRTFGLMCSSFDTAFRLSMFCLPNIIQYIGYMIPVQQMKRWLFWIYYINPLSYVFSGVVENEFHRINLSCDGSYVVPRNLLNLTKYPDALGPNQACTLSGSEPGSPTVTGAAYLKAGYSLNVADQWRRNLVILVGFFIAFQVTQVLLIEYFPQYHGNAGVIVYAKPSAKTEQLNIKLADRKKMRKPFDTKELTEGSDLNPGAPVKHETGESAAHRRTFTWQKINYTVPVPGGERRLLHDVYGYVKPGTLTALMGSSGAGKTTCLDVLAQRKNIGVVSGSILVDGRPVGGDFARSTAYAEQMDVHEGTATVREAMQFSARLRQPARIPTEEKDAYVEEMLELLELQDLADALVFSLGVEARKRLTIGVELASKPELLLFLDEPTSGLDGQSAWNLIRFLKKLAASGQAILCTIHQPSSLLFESFDRLLLLERGGETVYFGDIGPDSSVLRGYFARYGALCPANVNPAEYMLDAIGAGLEPRIGDRDWADIWRDSPEYKVMRQEIEDINQPGLARPVPEHNNETTYATSFWVQLKEVVRRNNMALWRSPDYVFTRLFIHTCISLQISLSFLQLGTSTRDLQNRVFGAFWATILPQFLMSQIEPLWISNRRIFIRESSSKIYSPYVFAIGQLVGEIPYSILCAFVYWILMVWPMGFGQGAAGANGNGFFFLVVLFIELFGVTFGQFIGSISPNIQTAALFNPFLVLILTTFCGVTIPYPTLKSFWRSWLYQLDPYTRAISAMLSTELHGLKITCQTEEFNIFSPPPGQTCSEWAQDFVAFAGGYLDNPNATDHCRYCQYAVGDQYTAPLNIEFSTRWRDVWILFGFFLFNFVVTIIASRLIRFDKR